MGFLSTELLLPSMQVRKVEHLAGVSGLIIPGGESTTMANVADRWGLVRRALSAARPCPTSLLLPHVPAAVVE